MFRERQTSSQNSFARLAERISDRTHELPAAEAAVRVGLVRGESPELAGTSLGPGNKQESPAHLVADRACRIGRRVIKWTACRLRMDRLPVSPSASVVVVGGQPLELGRADGRCQVLVGRDAVAGDGALAEGLGAFVSQSFAASLTV
jgi:hypothetical protein